MASGFIASQECSCQECSAHRQEPGSAPEPYARQSSMGQGYLYLVRAAVPGAYLFEGEKGKAHYLPTFILIIMGISSPTHSFTLGLNPYFSANPPYRSLPFSFSGFTIWLSQTVYCYF